MTTGTTHVADSSDNKLGSLLQQLAFTVVCSDENLKIAVLFQKRYLENTKNLAKLKRRTIEIFVPLCSWCSLVCTYEQSVLDYTKLSYEPKFRATSLK